MRTPHRLMLAAVLFTGLAWLFFLPPFEGFDEEAHWSTLSQIASDGRIPVYGVDRLDAAVEAYPGPHPYANAPPFDDGRGVTYRDFAASGLSGPHGAAPPAYAPGDEPNWQAQHPPLYYLALTPVKLAVSSLDWAGQFFVLRLVSWLFAFGGLAIAVEALARRPDILPPGGAVIAAAWPFLFPQFIPEMARLGNDSLCLLLLAVALVFVVRLDERLSLRDAGVLALALGAGLWTKAFFLPISAGVAAWFAWRVWLARSDGAQRLAWLKAGTAGIGGAAVLGGFWYASRLALTGDFVGGDEFVRIGEDTSLIAGLIQHFQITDFIRGLAAIAGSFGWAGSWSLARPSEILLLGPVLLMIWVLARWALQARNLKPIRALPAFVALPMVAGLVYHLLVRLSAGGGGVGTPGWYLHILAPVVMIAVAWGWRGSLIVKALAAYGVVFAGYVWTLHLSMFSGCAAKLGEVKRFTFESADCLVNPGQLAALGYPVMGGVALLLALTAGGFAVVKAVRAD
jgi:hypothetical protein